MEKRLALFLFALLLSIGTAFGQTKITGTVVSQDDGDPIIGASVMVQGTTMGTVTDIDGKFSLDVPAGKKLVVSYIGMVTQTLSPKAGMRVVLSNDNHTRHRARTIYRGGRTILQDLKTLYIIRVQTRNS